MIDAPDVQGEEFGRDAEPLFDHTLVMGGYSFDPDIVPNPQALANRIVDNINAWEGDLATRDRWERLEAMYRVDPAYVTMQAVEGMEPYPVPMHRIKCDNTVGSTSAAFFASEPYASIQSAAPPEIDAQRERANTKLVKESKLERAVQGALWCAWLYNLGIVHIAPTVKERLEGIEAGWIPPQDFCVYPSAEESAWKARTVGHRFYEPRWIIEQKMMDGVWYPCNVFVDANPRESEPNVSQNPMGTPSKSRRDDDTPELWEVETWHRTLSRGWVRLRCTVARNPRKLLRADVIELPVSNYATFRFVDNEKGLITKDSIAQSTQGLGLASSDMYTAAVQVALGKATPDIYVIGGSLGQERVKFTGWGNVYDDLPAGTDIQVVTPGGDINDLGALTEMTERWFDAVTGVSRAATNQELPSGTTATAINALANADARGQDRLLTVATDGFEQCLRIIDALWKYEYPRWVTLYGDAVKVTEEQFVNFAADVVSTARAVGSPQSLLQKLQALWEIAKDPTGGLDPAKVAYRIVQALDLPFDPDDVKAQMLAGVPLNAVISGVAGGNGAPGVQGVPAASLGSVSPDPSRAGEPVA